MSPESVGISPATAVAEVAPETRRVHLEEVGPSPSPVPLNANIAPLMDIGLKVSVLLGETHMTLGDLLKLGTGSVVELDRAAGDPIDILVNDRLYARGELVAVGESFGVRIIDLVGGGHAVAG